jgi:hypothetical protein
MANGIDDWEGGKPMTNIVVYQGKEEVLVCAADHEAAFLREYFAANTGRDRVYYERKETSAVVISTALLVHGDR